MYGNVYDTIFGAIAGIAVFGLGMVLYACLAVAARHSAERQADEWEGETFTSHSTDENVRIDREDF